MANLPDLVSLAAILQLPWFVWVPGLAIVLWLGVSGLFSVLRLRLLRAATRLVLGFAALVILSQGGVAISQFLGVPQPKGVTISVPSLPGKVEGK